jgi:CheY-like chemotaxis protein
MRGSPPDRDPSIPDLTGVSVLVVEDDEDARTIMHDVLRHCGAMVVTAAQPKRAFTELRRTRFDLIISDLHMPEMDGITFIRQLRGLVGRFASIPVLAVTAYDHLYRSPTLLKAGFTGLIRKPIDPGDLLRVVGALARAGRTQDAGN